MIRYIQYIVCCFYWNGVEHNPARRPSLAPLVISLPSMPIQIDLSPVSTGSSSVVSLPTPMSPNEHQKIVEMLEQNMLTEALILKSFKNRGICEHFPRPIVAISFKNGTFTVLEEDQSQTVHPLIHLKCCLHVVNGANE